MKLISSFPRRKTAVLTQLRTRRLPLNRHLHRIGKRDAPQCEYCPDRDETVRHFLFTCPRGGRARQALMCTLGREAFSEAYLLKKPSGINEVMKFVDQTGRLRSTFGSVRHTLYSGK
ncbi:hypothetical protein CONPUDRAFT_65411 [Coniophora puteana RWD-64-598 SS2]|uniref:Reverse transcriptase zinc-binding domain-containing protein n=1 Tax=Coniophora puteana (strain RWD-64-598) TaxID=741705 RepID=A0A5M3M9I5_CONPW|nr:uncharacterized protein CONPUDRAFT_65411 [Coniophora puteana RWD-64-598 SS2]EIW75829.1 hypothetical protein CONPUDRAFT_65411 [Coniophora puteana RWD-64-598 SS2]